MAKNKSLTNEQVLKRIINKELNTFQIGILRERIIKICELSLEDIEKNPKKWINPFYSVNYFKLTFEQILKSTNFDLDGEIKI